MNGGALPVEMLFNGLFWLYPLAGLTWLIAALILAEPDSDWARWFYDGAQVKAPTGIEPV